MKSGPYRGTVEVPTEVSYPRVIVDDGKGGRLVEKVAGKYVLEKLTEMKDGMGKATPVWLTLYDFNDGHTKSVSVENAKWLCQQLAMRA